MITQRGLHGLELLRKAEEGIYTKGVLGITKNLVDSLKRVQVELVGGTRS